MEKIYSQDQKNLMSSAEDWAKHPFTQRLLSSIDDRIKELESYLNGDMEMRDKESWFIKNIDKIEYSMCSVLRAELQAIKSIKNYPETVTKYLWILS